MDEEALAKRIIEHAKASERLSMEDAAKIVRVLNTADQQLIEMIAARYAVAQARGFDRGPRTTKWLEETLTEIRALNGDVYSKVGQTAEQTFIDNARAEIEWTLDAMEASGAANLKRNVPDANFLKVLVNNAPIATDNNGGGAILKSWIDKMEAGRLNRVEEAIRGGMARGAGTDDLVKLIRGTKAKGYTDGVLSISRRSAQTMALTANSTIQNEARLETFKSTRVVKSLVWSSIHDGRTSKICLDLDGKVFPIDGPHPMPPAHPCCRSLLLPSKKVE